jgi:hypothetical protein
MNLNRIFCSTAPAERTFSLTRHFVLTGDERCPIAGIWSRLEPTPQAAAQATDDPSLTRPAKGALLWRAVHHLFTPISYLPA